MSSAVALTADKPMECGACYRVLKPFEWYALKFVGRWAIDEGNALELRICTCGACVSRERPMLVSGERLAVR
jgi:hypothetical protein